jgi:hypothetical protein
VAVKTRSGEPFRGRAEKVEGRAPDGATTVGLRFVPARIMMRRLLRRHFAP